MPIGVMTGSRFPVEQALPSAPVALHQFGLACVGSRPGSRAGNSSFGLVANGLPPIADRCSAQRPPSRSQDDGRYQASEATGRRTATSSVPCLAMAELDASQKASSSSRRLKVKLLGVRGLRSETVEPFCSCEILGKLHTKVYPLWNRSSEISHIVDGDTLVVTLWSQDSSKEELLGRASLETAQLSVGFAGELPLSMAGRGGKAYLRLFVEVGPQKDAEVCGKRAANGCAGGMGRRGCSAPALSASGGPSHRQRGAPSGRCGSRGAAVSWLNGGRLPHGPSGFRRPSSSSRPSSVCTDGLRPSCAEADGCRKRGVAAPGAGERGCSLPQTRPTREANRPPSSEGRAMCIDSQTEIPEDLFDQMMKRASEVRSRGQHVLLRRPRSQGKSKLVHQSLAPKLSRGTHGGEGPAKTMLPIAGFSRTAPTLGRPVSHTGTSCGRRPLFPLGALPEVQDELRVINL